jgi:hypothetical protein
MSTKGVVDIVFCIDASSSMQPCIDAVRRHVVEFIRGLESNANQKMDWRIDYVAHSCDEGGTIFRMNSLRHAGVDLWDQIYHRGGQGLFTTSLGDFQRALQSVEVFGDEATLVALDTALDFPWRPRGRCHRVVVCLTDEPFETNAAKGLQTEKMPILLDKLQKLGVMLYLMAPPSNGFDRLSEVDKCEYEVLDVVGDGMRWVKFDKVLSCIGKSISMASLQSAAEIPVPRALFGQDTWLPINANLRGR